MTDKTIGENWLEVCADLQGQIVSHKVRIEALTAQNERLREALEAVWKEVERLRALLYPDEMTQEDYEAIYGWGGQG